MYNIGSTDEQNVAVFFPTLLYFTYHDDSSSIHFAAILFFFRRITPFSFLLLFLFLGQGLTVAGLFWTASSQIPTRRLSINYESFASA